MSFVDRNIDAPTRLETKDFILRPIEAADAQLDWEAVMETKEFLRKWERSTWPADDFTVEANRDDMVKMEDRHTRGESFGYTMMNPDQTECLGCVYVFATDANWYKGVQVTALGGDQWADCDAMISFWVRQSRLAEGMDRKLLDAMVTWFEQEWGFNAPVMLTNEELDQQVAMIEEAGLQRRFEITLPDSPAKDFAYASS